MEERVNRAFYDLRRSEDLECRDRRAPCGVCLLGWPTQPVHMPRNEGMEVAIDISKVYPIVRRLSIGAEGSHHEGEGTLGIQGRKQFRRISQTADSKSGWRQESSLMPGSPALLAVFSSSSIQAQGLISSGTSRHFVRIMRIASPAGKMILPKLTAILTQYLLPAGSGTGRLGRQQPRLDVIGCDNSAME